MDITIHPGMLRGDITAIPSKSQAHRLLICAAFADKPTHLVCPDTNQDIEATSHCLNQICPSVRRGEDGYEVVPYSSKPSGTVTLNCRESGSTLRFLLPILGALGIPTVFHMEGRLPNRPLSPLWEELERMGCSLSWVSKNQLMLKGQLQSGDYFIDGGVSSQFITGLLFAASLLPDSSSIHIQGTLQSAPYVTMTQEAMKCFGIVTDGFQVPGGQYYRSPGELAVEGDWSNAAFWLAAKALGSDLAVSNLNPHSPQGDRAVADLLLMLKDRCTISAADIPDLVPILAVFAACNQGAVFTDIQRLRMKESDRVESTVAMLRALGGNAEATEDTLTVFGTGLNGGTVDAQNDHRIAMSATIAATVCKQDVTILGAECVRKSYPKFFEEYNRLGGNYELNLR